MSSKKPAIPDVPPMRDAALRKVLSALKENTEVVTGRRGEKIAVLASDATLADTVDKINEVLARLQD